MSDGPSGFDRIEDRERRRRDMRQRITRYQIWAGVVAAAVGVLAVVTEAWWGLLLAAVPALVALVYEVIRRQMDDLNDLRFDWFDRQLSRPWRVLWRGWSEPPPGRKKP